MCGFVLILDEMAARSGRGDICEALAHRGPDSCGHARRGGNGWTADMHFRRLAIVDLQERSDQPFGDDAGLLLYNGEIYNAGALRVKLQQRGLSFDTEGDTEVMHAVLQQPDWRALLSTVDGMYAFAYVDAAGLLRYGRDRLGIKPLYEARDPSGRLVGLSSELEPLRRAGLLGDVDPAAVVAGAMFLWVPPPATGWRGVSMTSPATVTSVRLDAISSPEQQVALDPPPAFQGGIRDAVRTSLGRQVQADVPVALLLSGGLDSTWLAFELADMGVDVPLLSARSRRASAGSREPFQDDAPFAARVADRLGKELTWFDLDERILSGVPDMVATLEQPFADPAAVSLLGLSRAASREAKVLLSGVGVEELFLGYERYQAVKVLEALGSTRRPLASALRHFPAPARLRERSAKFERLLGAPREDWAWVAQSYYTEAALHRLAPDVHTRDVLQEHRKLAHRSLSRGATALDYVADVDRALFLPGLNLMYADRASMAASVELRVPFLGDPAVAVALRHQSAEHVRLGDGKRLFRQAAASAGVPDFVLRRSKTGFGAPVRSLLREHGSRVWSHVRRGSVFTDLLRRDFCDEMVQAHVAGTADHGLQIFSFCALAVWWESNVAGDGSVGDYLASSGL